MPGWYCIIVSATGYGTQEVTVPSGTTNLNVVLTRGEGKVIDEGSSNSLFED